MVWLVLWETVIAAVIFTVVGMIASHVSWMTIYGKELKAVHKKNPKLMKADMKTAMMKTTLMTFVTGVGVALAFQWAAAGLAAYGTLGGALLGAVLWIAFPLSMSVIDGAWFYRERTVVNANLLHWLLALIVGGYAVAWYLGL